METLRSWFDKQKLAIRAKLVFNTLRELKGALTIQKLERSEFIGLMRELLHVIQGVPDKTKEWLKYLSPYQLARLIHEPSREQEYQRTLRRDFDSLCEYDRLKDDLKFFEKEMLVKLHNHQNGWNALAMEKIFQNSIRLAWIDHIETKYPILRAVSSMKMDALQEGTSTPRAREAATEQGDINCTRP